MVLLCQLDCAEAALTHTVVQLKQHSRQVQDRRVGKDCLRQLLGAQLAANGTVTVIGIIPAGGEVFEKRKPQLTGIGTDDGVCPDAPRGDGRQGKLAERVGADLPDKAAVQPEARGGAGVNTEPLTVFRTVPGWDSRISESQGTKSSSSSPRTSTRPLPETSGNRSLILIMSVTPILVVLKQARVTRTINVLTGRFFEKR